MALSCRSVQDPYRMAWREPPGPRAEVLAEVTVVFGGSVLGVEHVAPVARSGKPQVYTLGDGPRARFQVPGEGLPVPEGTPVLMAGPDGLSLVLTRGLRGTFWSEHRRRPLADELSSRPWATRRLDAHTGCRIELGSVQVWIRGVPDDAAVVSRSPIERAPIVCSLVASVLLVGVLVLLGRISPDPLGPVMDLSLSETRYSSCGGMELPPVPSVTAVLGDHRELRATSPVLARASIPWAGAHDGARVGLDDLLMAPDPLALARARPGDPVEGVEVGSQGSTQAPAPGTGREPYVGSPWIATRVHASVGFRPASASEDPRQVARALARGRRSGLESLAESLADPATLLAYVAPEPTRTRGEALALSVESAVVSPGRQLVRVVVKARQLAARTGSPQTVVAHDVEIVARFDPAHVSAFRPVGHHQRALGSYAGSQDHGTSDVEADRVIVALYELELVADPPPGVPLADFEVHYRPTADAPRTERRIAVLCSGTALEDASEALRLASVAAQASEILAGAPHVAGLDLTRALERARSIAAETKSSRARGLVRLLRYVVSQQQRESTLANPRARSGGSMSRLD